MKLKGKDQHLFYPATFFLSPLGFSQGSWPLGQGFTKLTLKSDKDSRSSYGRKFLIKVLGSVITDPLVNRPLI